MSELYLMHFGAKGMHWGIRRWQNPDGTLTEAGKKRYASSYHYISKKGDKIDIFTSKEQEFTTKKPDSKGVKNEITYAETKHTMYVNGKKAVVAYLDKNGLDTNINWISTKTKYEGKGYAQEMMNHILKYSKDENGSLTVSLEVPDGDANALHIYKKYGFENSGERFEDYGLTGMKRKL